MSFIEVTPEQGLKVAEVLIETGCTYQGKRLREESLVVQAGDQRQIVTLTGKDERDAWEFCKDK